MFNAKRTFVLALILLVALVSGCRLLDWRQFRVVDHVTVHVEFHDTQLPLWSTVSIDDRVVTTETGAFSIALAPGAYDYAIQTLMGAHEGQLVRKGGTKDVRLAFPAPAYWNRVDFNDLLVSPGTDQVHRWERGRTVNVWIDPDSDLPQVQSKHVDMAWSAFEDWQSVLGAALTFERVASKDQADVTVEFGYLDGFAGRCTRSWNASGHVVRGEIVIAPDDRQGHVYLDEIGIYRHEVGHCIGLNHSSREHHLMYPSVGPMNNAITDAEGLLAQLLYSVPITAGALPVDGPTEQRLGVPLTDGVAFDPETGLYMEVIH